MSQEVRLGWDAPLPGTAALVGVLVGVHVATALSEWWVGRADLVAGLLYERETWFRVAVGGKHIARVAAEPWRLVTSVFLHTGPVHLGLNAVALAALGRVIEPWIGPLRLWTWFLLGGLAGSALSAAAGVRISDGASGGAFALLGAAVVLGWRVRARLDADDRRIVGPILWAFLGLNVVLSFALPFIDTAGHLGGLAAGLLCGVLVPVSEAPPWRGTPRAHVGEALFLGLGAVACAVGWIQVAGPLTAR